ncbi:uncharacterized protein LOC125756343 [Rhipicephalus sanguineus]|uniref:uncharacterized protein LOC125756343 n=1 Tax=Rhipicephalus sanguineus TaxID=34632 RepID=UPI0020C39EE5|nr:uncharacterized protein LOC125756343 [Rhipicephalus sanguineus]
MAEDLEAQKVIITSILCAHNGSMSLSKFQKEYKSIEGHVPFTKFGCATIHQFLNKISDTVEVVHMFGGKVALCAKANHGVDKVVKQQKPNAEKLRKQHKNSASTHKEHTYVQSLCVSLKKECPALVQESIPVTMQPFKRLAGDTCIDTKCCTDINCQSQDKGLYAQATHIIPSGHTHEPRSLEQSIMAGAQTENAPSFPSRRSDETGQVLIVREQKDNKTSSDLVVGVPDVVAACIKRLLQEYRNGLELGELLEKCKEKVGNSAYFMQRKHIEVIQDVLFSMSSVCVVADSEQKFRVMIHKSGTDEQNPATSLSDQLICQLMSVLIEHPQGLEISELLKLHHAQFGEHGYIKDLGPSTSDFVQNLLIKVPHTVVINHGNGTYSVKLHRECQIHHPHVQQRPASFASAENTSVPYITRAYCVQELPNSLIFPVAVGEVFSPSEFYILLTDDSLVSKLNYLVEELNLFYSTVPADFCSVSSEDLKPGLVCAALCAHNGIQVWQRVIVRRVTNHNVRVSRIDRGTVALVSIHNIRRLRSDFLQLPAQAIKASLANVKPRSQKSWLREAKYRFLQFVSKNDCMCSMVSRKDDIYLVELTRATDGADHASSLTDMLVDEGLAQSTKMSEERMSGNFMDAWMLSEGHHVNVITWNSVKYMSALGISKLFGCDSDLVSRKLTEKGISFRRAVLDRKCDPAFHYRICLCDGTFTDDGIQLYLLVNVPDILRLLQHPSKDLADELESRSLEPGAIVDISSTLSPPDAVEEDDLQMKLDFYMQTQDALRMAACQNPSPSTVSQLNYVKQKVHSLVCLLEQRDRMDVHQQEQEKEPTLESELVMECSDSITENSEDSAATIVVGDFCDCILEQTC